VAIDLHATKGLEEADFIFEAGRASCLFVLFGLRFQDMIKDVFIHSFGRAGQMADRT
jgi:hypothetical protein